MTTNNIIVLCAFIAYMIIMIVIGFVCSKGNKNNEDYFLGGRNLGSWTAAMSAQASMWKIHHGAFYDRTSAAEYTHYGSHVFKWRKWAGGFK